MRRSLIRGLNERDMTAVLAAYTLTSFYYPTLFPLKFTPTMTWKQLSANAGAPIMAEVVSYNSSSPKKSRQIVGRLQGDIVKIDVSREKEETEMLEYNNLLQYAGTTDGARALVDWIYEDTEFCFDGVNARLEWLALRAASTGKISLDKTNSAGIINENVVDFLIPATQKSGVAIPWATSATATPIANIKAKLKILKPLGAKTGFLLMDQDTFDNMAATAEVQKYAATWVQNALNTQQTPNLGQVNAALSNSNLPQIRIVDSLVQFEDKDGTRTQVAPWQAGVVAFVPSLTLGNTWYGPQAIDMVTESVAVVATRTHIKVRKYAREEPEVTEVTRGTSNSFPALAVANQMFLLDTVNASWTY